MKWTLRQYEEFVHKLGTCQFHSLSTETKSILSECESRFGRYSPGVLYSGDFDPLDYPRAKFEINISIVRSDGGILAFVERMIRCYSERTTDSKMKELGRLAVALKFFEPTLWESAVREINQKQADADRRLSVSHHLENLSPTELKQMFRSSSKRRERLIIASYPRTPIEIVKEALYGEDQVVAMEAVTNPSLNYDDLITFVRLGSGHELVRDLAKKLIIKKTRNGHV